MTAEEQQIRNTIGQLEASVDKAEKVMDDETFELYTADIYSCIAKWRAVIKTVKERSGE